ncbi:hypothetical protein B296_00025014 [Ensete ventricosum]|uniref:Uncharacterized protein n=1 Tax=Ensete ventricosum TaxID=4639 RepID=A0A426Y0E0_ENSVE|nr:hypothetical protein B296_00025014 [Ensete ventricosum]
MSIARSLRKSCGGVVEERAEQQAEHVRTPPCLNGFLDSHLRQTPVMTVRGAARLAYLAHELHDAAATFISRSSADEQSLRHRALAIDSHICKLRYSVETQERRRRCDGGREGDQNSFLMLLEYVHDKCFMSNLVCL